LKARGELEWDAEVLSVLSLELALVLVLGLLFLFVLLALTLGRARTAASPDSLSLLAQQLDALRAELSLNLRHQSTLVERHQQALGEQLQRASQSMASVGHQLGVLEQATERVLEVGRSVAAVEGLLRVPKFRGVLGETLLAEMLRQALPPALFELQYRFRGGETVDAVVRVGELLLPVDAKFPLDNLRRLADGAEPSAAPSLGKAFARDFRKHVDDIAAKYIAPDQGTLPMAFLYVPAENVYQQAVLGEPALAEYALSRRVIPVGPLGFYACLQSVLYGARSVAAAGEARHLLAGLEQVASEVERLREETGRLARHLGFARAGCEDVERRVGRLDEAVERARSALDPGKAP
jgi:DNA recombination protein RmuC